MTVIKVCKIDLDMCCCCCRCCLFSLKDFVVVVFGCFWFVDYFSLLNWMTAMGGILSWVYLPLKTLVEFLIYLFLLLLPSLRTSLDCVCAAEPHIPHLVFAEGDPECLTGNRVQDIHTPAFPACCLIPAMGKPKSFPGRKDMERRCWHALNQLKLHWNLYFGCIST